MAKTAFDSLISLAGGDRDLKFTELWFSLGEKSSQASSILVKSLKNRILPMHKLFSHTLKNRQSELTITEIPHFSMIFFQKFKNSMIFSDSTCCCVLSVFSGHPFYQRSQYW